MPALKDLHQVLFLLLTLYLTGVNLIGLCAMGWDKRRARRQQRRVPERTLFMIALLGGSVGSWAGMYLFCHKTKHLSFVIGIPAILAVQLLAAGWLLWRFLG